MSPKMTITNIFSLHMTKLTLVTDFNVDSQAGWEHGQRTNTRRCVCINFYNRSLNMENSPSGSDSEILKLASCWWTACPSSW